MIVKMIYNIGHWSCFTLASGLYYKPITIVNDASWWR